MQSVVCGLQSAVCGLQSAVCSLRSAVCSLQSAVCKCHTPVYRQRKVFSINFTLGLKLDLVQGRIQDFLKEGIVSMRVQGKHPRAKGTGEGVVGG